MIFSSAAIKEAEEAAKNICGVPKLIDQVLKHNDVAFFLRKQLLTTLKQERLFFLS